MAALVYKDYSSNMASIRLSITAVMVLLAHLILRLPVSVWSQKEGSGGGRHQGALVVYVDAVNGKSDPCLASHADSLCSSLEAVATGILSLGNVTSLEVFILSPLLELKEPVKFERLAFLRIVGNSTEVQCVSNNSTGTKGNSTAGVVLVEIRDLFVTDLVFNHCGAFYDYSAIWKNARASVLRSALHVLSSGNITIEEIDVVSSNGAGLVMTSFRGGTVSVVDSRFESNTVPVGAEQQYSGGGGIQVRVQNPLPGDFFIHNCTFFNNTASNTFDYKFSSIFGTVLAGRGQGGGLLIEVKGGAFNTTVIVSKCVFLNNSAFFGGGISIQMSDSSYGNQAVVRDSYFQENGCQPGSESASGGGAHLGYSFHTDNVHSNTIAIRHSTFTSNCAELGGGTTLFSSRSNGQYFGNEVDFTNCSWIGNSARIGAAVDISPHISDRLSTGFLPTPQFSSCKFINNRVSFRKVESQQAVGRGALFSSLFNVKFITSVEFEQNTYSALVIVNGVANFSTCNAVFVNNTGVQGGAISLVGVSSLIVGPGFAYQFLHNTASNRGGAICSYLIDEHDFSASHSCFIQYSVSAPLADWNTTILFKENMAPVGKSIFTTAISACRLSGITFVGNAGTIATFNDSESVYWHPFELLKWPAKFYFDLPIENQIATDGAYLEAQTLPFQIIPGDEHLLQVDIMDDFNQSASTALQATIHDADNATSLEIDEAFTYIEDKIIKVRGRVGEKGNLLLQFASLRRISIIANITIVPCPVGFEVNEENECECDVSSYEGLTECDANTMTAYIREGFWTGYESEPVTGVCPVEFCKYNDSDVETDLPLPGNATWDSDILNSFICGPSREGVLCGDCTDGHSAYYHSPYFSCKRNKHCVTGWLFYILSELVPATILFVVILALNICFTSGKLNGFIFFSQLIDTLFIDASDLVKVPHAVSILSWGYHIVYGVFSLNFFTIEPLSFCLWEGATALDVLAFKYVTIAYSLILVILVIVFMKYFARRLLGRRMKVSPLQTSVIHGLSAFLVVCYVQCIKVSLQILLSQSLRGKGGRLLSPARVWFSGETKVFSPKHLPYAIPALLCLLTLGTISPILLLIYPYNYKIAAYFNITHESYPKLSRLYKTLALHKLKPILDSFQGCFKDNMRFFAGLYFVYRWVGLLAYAISPSLSGIYAIQQVLLTLILTIHATAQPYEKRWYNIIDTLLIMNLALINLVTFFNYYYTRLTTKEIRDQTVIDATSSIQLILIYLPILAMTAYIFKMVYKKYHTGRAVAGVDIALDEFPARLYGDVDTDADADYEAFEDLKGN